MTVIATKQKVLSSVLMDDVNALVHDYNYAHGQEAREGSDTTYSLGQVVVWDTDHWEILKTGVALSGGSTAATANNPLAVVVGFDSLGDSFDETVGSSNRNVVVVYQGAVNVKEAGLVLDAGLSGAEETAAKEQLAAQGIKLAQAASKVASNFYGA